MINTILKFKRFLKDIIFYRNFIQYGLDSYIKLFHQFYYQTPKIYSSALYNLQRNLDEASKNNVTRFLEMLLKLPLPSKDYLVKFDSLYNLEEKKQIKEEQKFRKNINQYYKKYHLKGFEKLEVNVFKYHCGLKLLNKNILHNLKNKTLIDGGAFFGDSVLVLTKYSPKKIIAFEPNSINYALLENTIISNNLENFVISENIGLNNEKSLASLNYNSKNQNHGASFIFKANKHLKKENKPLTTLDSYLLEKNINDEIALIKLDVEGLGLKALEGARNTIIKHQPIISCAIYHNPEELFYIKPFLEALNPNYKFLIAPLSQEFILKELTLIAYIENSKPSTFIST